MEEHPHLPELPVNQSFAEELSQFSIESHRRPSQGDAAIAALKVAKAILADEAARLKLPQWQLPSLASKPYG